MLYWQRLFLLLPDAFSSLRAKYGTVLVVLGASSTSLGVWSVSFTEPPCERLKSNLAQRSVGLDEQIKQAEKR